MKKPIIISFCIAVVIIMLGVVKMLNNSPSLAQNKYVNQWEYAAITSISIPFDSENKSTLKSVVNICYVQATGCQNEEVNAELIYNKFIQDYRLENTNSSKSLAYNQVKDLAFSKALMKLGQEGWEMVSPPSFVFDDYIPNAQGNYTIVEGSKMTKPNIYFKRLKQ